MADYSNGLIRLFAGQNNMTTSYSSYSQESSSEFNYNSLEKSYDSLEKSYDSLEKSQEGDSSVAQAVAHSLNLFELPYESLTFKDGEMIYSELHESQGVYLLKSGCVKIFVKRDHVRGRTTSPEFITHLIAPGEVFGFKEIIEGQVKSNAEVVKTATVWLYRKNDILKLIAQAHPLVQKILKHSMQETMHLENMGQLHYLASVQERIAHQLVLVGDRFGIKTDRGISINLKLTRNELAQLASTINESLSRHLTELKNDGLIELNGKEIIILNREGLLAKSNSIG